MKKRLYQLRQGVLFLLNNKVRNIHNASKKHSTQQQNIPDVWRRTVYSVWQVYNEFRDKYKGIFCFRCNSFFNKSNFFTFIRNFTLSCLVCCVVINNTMKLFQSFYIKILHRLCWGATYVSRPTIATQYRKGICSVLSKWGIFLFKFTCVLTIAEHEEGVSKKPNVAHVAQCRYRKSICSLLNRYYYGDI